MVNTHGKKKPMHLDIMLRQDDYIRFYSEERPQDRYHCKTPLEVRNEALFSESPVGYPIPRNKRIEKYKEKWCA